MEGIPWLTQILNRIGKNDDAAAMNTTLFAGQQKIADDIAALPTTAQVNAEVDAALNTAIPGSPTAGSVNDVLKDLDARLPGSGTLSTLAAGDVPLTVPSADSTDNVYERDVIGNKNDAAVTTVGTTKSAMAYLKGLITNVQVHGTQEYTSGSGNWTCPAGVYQVNALLVSGGGGGGFAGKTSTDSAGGGGGGGAVGVFTNIPVIPGTAYPYSVGAGGTGGTSGDGGTGGTTSFRNLFLVGGESGKGGTDVGARNGGAGAACKTLTGGTYGVANTSAGGNGNEATYGASGVGLQSGGGGGGSKTGGGSGFSGGTTAYVPTAAAGGNSNGGGGGGGSSFGIGGAGAAPNGAGSSAAANTGGGGGGAMAQSSGQSYNGGTGGSGYIFLWW